MKKLATLLTLMTGAGLAFGQAPVHNDGFVSFQNSEITKGISHLVTNGIGGSLLSGTQYNAELYYFDTTANSLKPLASTISQFKSSSLTVGLGIWNGPVSSLPLPAGYGGVDIDDNGTGELGVDAPGHTSPNGDGLYPVQLQVVVWNTLTGATWETATQKGNSATFTYLQRFANGGPPPSVVTDQQMLNQKGFAVVPEPSAIALSVIGVAGLLFLRRRK